MFCPDNFYEILKCRYTWPATHNCFLQFDPHGSKLLEDLKIALSNERNYIWNNNYTSGDQCAYGKILLHDQEPFSFQDAAYTYKTWMHNHKNHPRSGETIDAMSCADAINVGIRSGLQPILCHSEMSSPDIQAAVDQCHMIECYYWYHAMVARDWFRHWQYHPDLKPRDRSQVKYRFMMYARGLDGSRSYRNAWIRDMEPYKDYISYDWARSKEVHSTYSAKIDVDDANQSAIHIVLETLFDTEKIHLTEKIFKPMVMSQPFFLLAGPGALAYLRDYGFQTFSDFWDESYDLITDGRVRMERIRREIARLLALPQDQFQDLYRSLLPIIEHNRQRFFSMDFQDQCITEMDGNFSRALVQQRMGASTYPGGSWCESIARLSADGVFLSENYTRITKELLRSDKLLVSAREIIARYPSLSRFLD